jgi:hypothetical protein
LALSPPQYNLFFEKRSNSLLITVHVVHQLCFTMLRGMLVLVHKYLLLTFCTIQGI